METLIIIIELLIRFTWNLIGLCVGGCILIVMFATLITIWDIKIDDVKEIFRK